MSEDEMRALDERIGRAMGWEIRTMGATYGRECGVCHPCSDCEEEADPGTLSEIGMEPRSADEAHCHDEMQPCYRIGPLNWRVVPRFSTDGAAMLALMEWLENDGWDHDIGTRVDGGYHASVYRDEPAQPYGDSPDEPGLSAPLALALAADAALAARP